MYKDLLGDIESDIDRNWSELSFERENRELKSQLSHIHNILDEIVSINMKNRNGKEFLPLDNYISSFCTIRLNIGRQIGITTWIRNRAKEGDIIIVPRQEMINYSYRDVLNKRDVVTIDGLKQRTSLYVGVDYNNIYIDVASYLSQEDIYNIIHNLLPRPDIEQTFFLLG
jgi:hypothetical protein